MSKDPESFRPAQKQQHPQSDKNINHYEVPVILSATHPVQHTTGYFVPV